MGTDSTLDDEAVQLIRQAMCFIMVQRRPHREVELNEIMRRMKRKNKVFNVVLFDDEQWIRPRYGYCDHHRKLWHMLLTQNNIATTPIHEYCLSIPVKLQENLQSPEWWSESVRLTNISITVRISILSKGMLTEGRGRWAGNLRGHRDRDVNLLTVSKLNYSPLYGVQIIAEYILSARLTPYLLYR